MKNYLFAFLLLVFANVSAQKKAVVTRVIDGDTFEAIVLQTKDTIKVRVSYLNTPEGKNGVCAVEQPFYLEAKEAAEEYLLGKTVLLYMSNVQSYDREIARVKCSEGYFDVLMINRGLGWSFIQNNASHYQFKLQQKAKAKGVGLWNPLLYPEGESPQNPSNWIKIHSTKNPRL